MTLTVDARVLAFQKIYISLFFLNFVGSVLAFFFFWFVLWFFCVVFMDVLGFLCFLLLCPFAGLALLLF